jgi:cellulose synthase/poly-beta-1,6-N-acetylglucosamine synthase-like glycosyltransferase
MFALNAVLILLALVLSLPALVFSLEVILSLLPQRQIMAAQLPPGARLAVLIPAHNEQAVIGATLKTLMPTIPAGCSVLVVADNCTDATAAVARQSVVEVVERSDSKRRGKGYALDYGLRHLSQNPPHAVVFLDADCRVSPGTVRLLGAVTIATQRPVQGLNLCDPNPDGSVTHLLSGLAFRFKNLVRTLGLVRLVGLSYLTGTGMALPWSLIQQAKFADGNVVEDMQLGIDLTLAGRPPLFLPEAQVDSPLPQQQAAARTQRTRWEHGHLTTLLTQSPRLVLLAVRHRRLDLLWLALDLAIPPLSLLVLTTSTATAISAVAWLRGGSAVPLVILATNFMLLGAALLAGWARHCRQQVPLRALFAAPLYAAAKLPIYLAFLMKRQKSWVRTERDVQT